jgi:hypothetical protein
MHTLRCALALTTLLALTACGSASYRGKAIAGQVGRAMVLSDADPRFDEAPGIPGITVTASDRERPGRAPEQLATAVTDDEGNFRLSFKKIPEDRVTLTFTADTIYTARSAVYMPSKGKRILATVVPIDPTPGQ